MNNNSNMSVLGVPKKVEIDSVECLKRPKNVSLFLMSTFCRDKRV